jgi:hypothetical protein
MRAIVIAMLAGAAIGFLHPSDVSAAPANGAVIGEAAGAAHMIEKTRRYRRLPHRRVPYYGPYERTDLSGGISLHQLSQENQERAQTNYHP